MLINKSWQMTNDPVLLYEECGGGCWRWWWCGVVGGGGVLLPRTAPLIPLPSSHMMWVIGSFISVNWWTNFSLLEVNWSTTTDERSISRSRHPGRWLSTTRMPERCHWADLAQSMTSIRHHCVSQNILTCSYHVALDIEIWTGRGEDN